MATEQEYDEHIAPLLLEIAKKCSDLGMAIVARVEWEPGKAGVTQMGNNAWSVAQRLTQLAALCHGNIDNVCIHLMREFDVSQSAILYKYQANPPTTEP